MPRLRIALIFDNTLRPETTGTYCLRALRTMADVEFFTPAELDHIPASGFDFYLNIDDGLRYRLPRELRPCAWWVIDTHMDLAWALDKGKEFDWLFAAQKDGTGKLRESNLPVSWLPLACDPAIHRPYSVHNQWDVSFVGRISSGPRQDLLRMIHRHFPRSFIGECYFEEYARTCSASLIGFNRSVKNDLNMRVFETMACGPLLITNDIADNGQSDLFETDRHLVTYRDESELLEKLKFYVRSEQIRREIAMAGHAEVVSKHTYAHRMRDIVTTIESALAKTPFALSHRFEAISLPHRPECLDQVDIVIKTFLRPIALLRLLESIRRFWPSATVTVADDGNLRMGDDAASLACLKLFSEAPTFRLIELPFAIGVTPGRNELVRQTKKPYLLFLDDDFVITAETNLERLWHRLQDQPDFGVAAGACIDVIHGNRMPRNSGGTMTLSPEVLSICSRAWRDEKNGFREYVPQFMLIRRQVFQDVVWEGGIGGEHYDFCLQLMKSRWKVIHDLSVTIDHHPLTEALPGYEAFRFDCAESQQWLLRKWKLQKIEQDGKVIVEQQMPASIGNGATSISELRPEKDASYFEFARPEVAALVPTTARRVLDIGCGTGRLGALLKSQRPMEITGLELNQAAAQLAQQVLDRVIQHNVEDPAFELERGYFDCIICADVLEHLRDPSSVLAKIRNWLSSDGSMVISLPNVRHHSVVSGLLDGNWTYEAAGLLDNDHVRFFTRREMEKLLYRQGFKIASLVGKPGSGHAEWLVSGQPGRVNVGALTIEGLAPDAAEEFFIYQYLIVAQPEESWPTTPLYADSISGWEILRKKHAWPISCPDVPLPTDNLGWCNAATQELLSSELKKPTHLVVELGAWLGLSTKFIASHAPDARIISIDHWRGSPEHHARHEWAAMLPTLFETYQKITWELRDRVTPLRMTTLEGLGEIAKCGLTPDLIFVDADHSFDAVTADLETCHSLFPNARLMGDDYEDADVHRAVDSFAQRTGLTVQTVGRDWRSWRLVPQEWPSRSASGGHGLTSIIIVTYNELGFTKECVDSIRLRTDEPYELIFVDNGSTDGSPNYLSTVPGSRLIRNAENRGFPAAVNQGLALAQGQQVLLLNNDTVVSTGWLRKMLSILYSAPDVGLVGPCSNCVSGAQMIFANYSDMTSMDGFAWDWGKSQRGIREETDRLIGFCLLIRMSVLRHIGGLDERFGVGCFEDDDICRRAIGAGWKAVIARESFVHHYGSRTFASSGVDFAALMHDNQQKFLEKWGEESIPVAPQVHVSPLGFSAAAGGGLLLDSPRPHLSLCMIVRNNEGTIRPCLESIRPWVDEMVVIDTGSTDETPRICEELGAQVHYWRWRDDFSAARNQSLEHAKGEWLFWMDSDDTISEECGRKLRTLAYGEHPQDMLGYVMQVHCPGPESQSTLDVTAVDHVKLIRNRSDLRFEHRIHEQILPAIRRAGGDVAFTDIYVVHSGSDHSVDGRARKVERDFRLLELDLKERPDHPFVLFNLGMTCADTQRHVEAVEWLTKCLEVSHNDESHVRKAYALLISSLMQLKDYRHATLASNRSRQLFPNDKELLFRQAMMYHELGELDQAATLYNEVLAPECDRHFASVDLGLSGYKARHNLALVYEDQSRVDLAEAQWRTILAELPEYSAAQIGLTDILLKTARFDEADRWIEKLCCDERTMTQGIRLKARRIEVQVGITPAIHELEVGLNQHPDSVDLLREWARMLHANRSFAMAHLALQKLTTLSPNDQSHWNNLAVVLSELRRDDEAQIALERAASLRQDQKLSASLSATD